MGFGSWDKDGAPAVDGLARRVGLSTCARSALFSIELRLGGIEGVTVSVRGGGASVVVGDHR